MIGLTLGISAYTRIFTDKNPPINFEGHLGTVQLAFEVVVAFLLAVWVLDLCDAVFLQPQRTIEAAIDEHLLAGLWLRGEVAALHDEDRVDVREHPAFLKGSSLVRGTHRA